MEEAGRIIEKYHESMFEERGQRCTKVLCKVTAIAKEKRLCDSTKPSLIGYYSFLPAPWQMPGSIPEISPPLLGGGVGELDLCMHNVSHLLKQFWT